MPKFLPISSSSPSICRNGAIFASPSTFSLSIFRWLCLAICILFAIGQLLFFHRHLFSLMPISTTPGAILPPFSNSSKPLTAKIDQQKQRLPDFLIIGARKGGTRALLDALSLHPKIRVARHEVHFFDNEQHFRLGPQWYRAQMPFARMNDVFLLGEIDWEHFEDTLGFPMIYHLLELVNALLSYGLKTKVIIEKTPAYFTANPKVPKRVYELNPRMKLIVILREPVARTVSDFTQIQQTKRERHKPALDFERMSLISGKNGSIVLNTRFKPIRNSLYVQHFARWLEFFPRNQFLVLDGDKFIQNPLSQLRIAEHFLGLEPAIRPAQLVYVAKKGFYCFRPERNNAAHCLGQSKGRKQIWISTQFRRLLSHKFAPSNRKLFALLNRHFSNWKTN